MTTSITSRRANFSVVAPRPGVLSIAQRAQQLALEATVLADEEASNLLVELQDLAQRCGTAATLQMLKPGVQEGFRRLAAEITGRTDTIQAIRVR